ncbi:MAG TPA: hypothetical protein VFH61_08745 [Thermoleophilia bacterium]|nr:hypothetical protein [Thermoleophilia bacterium]
MTWWGAALEALALSGLTALVAEALASGLADGPFDGLKARIAGYRGELEGVEHWRHPLLAEGLSCAVCLGRWAALPAAALVCLGLRRGEPWAIVAFAVLVGGRWAGVLYRLLERDGEPPVSP